LQPVCLSLAGKSNRVNKDKPILLLFTPRTTTHHAS
jgi:hypothetical protein